MKKDYPKYVVWRIKKDNDLILVCSEANLAFVPIGTWWVDSGASTHISVSMQGYLWSQPPSDVERFIYVGDENKVPVEAIWHFRLLLNIGCYLDLFDTFVSPTFKRNLVSTSSLDKSEIIAPRSEILHANSKGTIRKLNENFASLWHNHLGHISKQRIQRLVSDGILDSLDLTCVVLRES
ncbi:hypothetical protein V2J09_009346 [Rumex salicifolius]